MLKFSLKNWLPLAFLLVPCLSSANIVVGFGTPGQTGNLLSVPLTISGLTDSTAPSLSTFDINVLFDPAYLSFNAANFGDPVLGDQLDLSSLGGNPAAASFSAPNKVNLFELSLDSSSELNSLQAGEFTLATLTFNVLSGGSSQLAMTVNSLGDAVGNPLAAGTLSPLQVVGAVPLPPSVFLLISGLAFFPFRNLRR